jgi:hypothetical protein
MPERQSGFVVNFKEALLRSQSAEWRLKSCAQDLFGPALKSRVSRRFDFPALCPISGNIRAQRQSIW